MPLTSVYIGCAESASILHFALDDATGAMALRERSAFPGPSQPTTSTPLALHPDGARLYTAVRYEPFKALVYGVAKQDGALTLTGEAPLAHSMPYLSVDRTGRFLFSASYGGGLIAVNRIGAGGALDHPHQVIATGPKTHCVIPSPDNRFVFAVVLGEDRILSFRFDPEAGVLAPNDPAFVALPDGCGPRHLVFAADGRFAYAIDELGGFVRAFAYDAELGTLSPVQALSVMPEGASVAPWGADLHLSPEGRFLYTTERNTSTLSVMALDPADGRMTMVQTLATEENPRGFAVSPSGRWLIVVGENSHHLSLYARDDATGLVSLRERIATDERPNWVTFRA